MRIRTVPHESRQSRDNHYRVGVSLKQAEERGRADRRRGFGFTRSPYSSLDKQRAWEKGWEAQHKAMM